MTVNFIKVDAIATLMGLEKLDEIAQIRRRTKSCL